MQQKQNNTEIPRKLKTGMENLSDYSWDCVPVSDFSQPPAIHSLVHIERTNIPVDFDREQHSLHKVWHITQQRTQCTPTTEVSGIPVNDDAGLEHEADVMGDRANKCK